MDKKKEKNKRIIHYEYERVRHNQNFDYYFPSVTSISNVILDPIVGEHQRSSPERLLFLSVIYQGILDASREELPNESDLIKRQRKEAISWFFDDKYIDDLDEVCYLAGINPSWLVRIVKQILDGDLAFDRKRINVLINSTDN
jgi:hypothetical protein|tara:strand:- start:650 stop:1078 length:429 start_codon:yes stop_codon:yes gene_type:complete